MASVLISSDEYDEYQMLKEAARITPENIGSFATLIAVGCLPSNAVCLFEVKKCADIIDAWLRPLRGNANAA